ncbi:hypothetical protein AB6A40_002843 [Gnathostoma spinigerum]|uniref:RNA-binding protein NOB1 n=1 Tax=Gnathostoma spinigerum TaxID=75299 RepID=A0ABD6EDA9_9BILA
MKRVEDVAVEHLIVDSGAFIKHAQLQDLGAHIYTSSRVISELKCSKSKQHLESLPYEIILKEPMPESVKIVSEYAKKTGDYPSLSVVDLIVLALVYEMFMENGGTISTATTSGSKTQSDERKENEADNENLIKDETAIAGFYIPKKPENTENEEETTEADKSSADFRTGKEDMAETTESDNETEESDNEDESGWLDLSNIDSALKSVGAVAVPAGKLKVGCITTDFAMQNVMLSMGLPLLSLDGYRIRKLKTYILRCRACYATTSVMEKRFCPRCGNDSLHRAPVTVNPDGTMEIHLNYQRLRSTRGLKFSLPAPKGGKHAIQPRLFEDQPMPQNRLARCHQDPLDDSPFVMHDITSRSAALGLRSMMNRTSRPNPNVGIRGKKRGGKRR